MYRVLIQYLVLGIDRKLICLRYWSSTTGSGIGLLIYQLFKIP